MNDKDTVVVPRASLRELRLAEKAYGECKPGAVERLDAALAAVLSYEKSLAAAPSTSVREEVEYEVWQDDAFGDGEAMVAGSTNLADARHYAAVYSQDGPAWVVEVTRRHFRAEDPAALVPSTDEGKRHG